MKLSLDKESAEVLRAWAEIIPVTISNIIEDTLKVVCVYQSVADELGIHQKDFRDMLIHIKKAQEQTVETKEFLSSMLIVTAEKIDAYVGGNTSASFLTGYDDIKRNSNKEKTMHDAAAVWCGKLSIEEKKAINDYTKETPNYYRNINEVLRGKSKTFEEGNQERCEFIHFALSKASTPANVVVYRGGNNILGDLTNASDDELVGSVFRDKGFVSTSVSDKLVLSGDTLLVINLPMGSQAANIEKLSATKKYEQEVLINCGQMFCIKSVSRDSFGRRVIELDAIQYKRGEHGR